MRFVSKSANLMLVLKQGFPGNHMTGTAPISGVYIKFQNGIVDVKEQSLIDLMMKHPGFNLDFISTEEEEADPFEYLRNESEPSHTLTEIKYGHAEKSVGNKKPIKFSPEIKAALHEEALKMAKEMLPGMMREVLKEMKSPANTGSGEIAEGSANLPFCDQCASKGVRHLAVCPKSAKTPNKEE